MPTYKRFMYLPEPPIPVNTLTPGSHAQRAYKVLRLVFSNQDAVTNEDLLNAFQQDLGCTAKQASNVLHYLLVRGYVTLMEAKCTQ